MRVGMALAGLVASCCLCAAAPAPDTAANPGGKDTPTSGMIWRYKKEMLRTLVAEVPSMLREQDPATGRWGSGIWIVGDQHPMYALAAAWAFKDPDNPYYHDARVLEAVLKGGDALLADADKKGQWEFRKKDGSTWGMSWMPWTYSRWIRSYALVKEGMPAGHRAKWKKALMLAYSGIADKELSSTLNIPAHHAMGLYFAAREFDRPDWADKAAGHLRKIAAKQFSDGYWSEHVGPVIGYNRVYVEAIGLYYAASRDATMLPVLDRAARFHAHFTYPDGSSVETVDERQLYHAGASVPGLGFSFTPAGRGYLKRQWDRRSEVTTNVVGSDGAASFLIYGEEGPAETREALDKPRHHVTQDGKALIHGDGNWFVCMSGYCAEVVQNRWIQDRQNLVSLFNEKGGGLILGGGNSKLTPLWSTFTMGDIGLLRHEQGDSSPRFTPPPGVWHVPSESHLDAQDLAMRLRYANADFQVKVAMDADGPATVTYSQLTPTTAPAAAHMPLFAQKNKPWSTESGQTGTLNSSAKAWKLGPGEAGSWFQHAGWRISVPPEATIEWPVTYHNQYAKYGETPPGTGAVVMTLPFDAHVTEHVVTVTIP